MSELLARRLDSRSGDQMHVEVWLQYERNRASAMNDLGRGSSKPASTTANKEAEAFHFNEVQKDLLALGLLESIATNPSSREVMWKAAIVKFEWMTTKDSVSRASLLNERASILTLPTRDPMHFLQVLP
ncbi:hypothetical protein NM688_g178 [Phlebia brevispora]|uniref:Uncharacterized protein n=1 Tax=Phlebia brevispora TaxID=194682 RepID=A0ACC1TEZ1_9APHY|nr:hypothetical protein NM688_g178 [Phlebia brevispora]